jgi:hypothetical protein
MRPRTFGRAVGIGLRVAGKTLLRDGQQAKTPDAAQQAREQALRQTRVRAAGERGKAVGTGIGQGTRGVARGTRNFGRAVWNPFALASGVLWLEITGMFFALFALFFAQHAFALRANYRLGPDHERLFLYAGLTLLFVYFSVSSFLRARQKSRKG